VNAHIDSACEYLGINANGAAAFIKSKLISPDAREERPVLAAAKALGFPSPNETLNDTI
jgi:hypothetical protein